MIFDYILFVIRYSEFIVKTSDLADDSHCIRASADLCDAGWLPPTNNLICILTQLLAKLLQEFVIPMCLMNLTNRESNKEKKRVVLFTATVNIWITPCTTSGK